MQINTFSCKLHTNKSNEVLFLHTCYIQQRDYNIQTYTCHEKIKIEQCDETQMERQQHWKNLKCACKLKLNVIKQETTQHLPKLSLHCKP
jgi:hypothetical protein